MSESEVSKDNTRNQARRKILRSLVAGGGALTAAKMTPQEWIKPVVETVVLPSHATTSVVRTSVSPFGKFSSGPVVVDGINRNADQLIADEPISEELLEFFMPSARAQIGCVNASCNVEISADVQNAVMYVCLSGDEFGSARYATTTGAGNPCLVSGGRLSVSLMVENGCFEDGKWLLGVNNLNVSTMVTLTPGGGGCLPPD